MITNGQEIAAATAEVEKGNDFHKLFPIVGFIVRHPIELLALAITLIGIAGFAAGSSFFGGWNKAAGVSNNLFPVGTYETILAGIALPTPWIYSGLAFAFIVVYIHLLELSSEWVHARTGRETFWQRHRRWKIVMAARSERLSSALESRQLGDANRTRLALGLRNRWGEASLPLTPKAKRLRKVTVRAGALIVALSAMGMTCILYLALKAFIIDIPQMKGAEKYVGLHLAVTGKVPAQIESTIGLARMQELACIGEDDRWTYRSVDLVGDGNHQAYVIQSTDKFFLLLDKDGSSMHSFGDAAFSLRENANRPISKLAQNCSKAVVKK
jgi:hypothetical protein